MDDHPSLFFGVFMANIKVYVHKCDSWISSPLHWFHKYGDVPKFSHYAMSFVTDLGNRIFIDTAEHNVHLVHSDFFFKRWKIVGVDHEFIVDDVEFFKWLEPKMGQGYGYWTLIGHAFKKLLKLRSNPFGDGVKKLICNEIALRFVMEFFGVEAYPEDYDLMESEAAFLRAVDAQKKLLVNSQEHN